MKKILFGLSLSLTLIFSACSSPFGSTCTYPNAAPPGTPWSIVYSDQVTVRSGNAKADGSITIPKFGGETCEQLRFRLIIGRNMGLALSASPTSVYLPSPPTSGTVTGQSFDATYGMPRVDYFDSSGYLIGSAYTTSVSSDGTWLQADLPDLSSAYSGTYMVKVTNKTYSGYYLDIVGSATMTGWGRDRPDSDGDGWYDDEDCDPYDPYLNYSCTQTCGGDGIRPYEICQPY